MPKTFNRHNCRCQRVAVSVWVLASSSLMSMPILISHHLASRVFLTLKREKCMSGVSGLFVFIWHTLLFIGRSKCHPFEPNTFWGRTSWPCVRFFQEPGEQTNRHFIPSSFVDKLALRLLCNHECVCSNVVAELIIQQTRSWFASQEQRESFDVGNKLATCELVSQLAMVLSPGPVWSCWLFTFQDLQIQRKIWKNNSIVEFLSNCQWTKWCDGWFVQHIFCSKGSFVGICSGAQQHKERADG